MTEDQDYIEGESDTRINVNEQQVPYVAKIEKIRISDHGPWIATYSGEDGVLAAWEITEDPDTGQYNDVQFRWSRISEQGCFTTITISPDGNYLAGHFSEKKEILVYSRRDSKVIQRKMEVDCIPTFLSSGQLALLTDHCLELLEPPHFKEGHFYRIPQTDEFWRRYNQPLHRGIIYRSEPNNHLSFWSIASGGGLIRYVRTGITDWDRTGIAVSQTGTLVALYCKTSITVLHAASGMLAASFEWPDLETYDQTTFFDFVNGDRFLVGCFWAEDGDDLYVRMWRWDMDNSSFWISDPESVKRNTSIVLAVFPRDKGILIESHTDDGLRWAPRITPKVEGLIRPVNSFPKDHIGDTMNNSIRNGVPSPDPSIYEGEDEKDNNDDDDNNNNNNDDQLNDDEDEEDSSEVPYNKEFKKASFNVQVIEPWENDKNELGMAYLLDEDLKIQLLVGRSTIQLWATKYIRPPTVDVPPEELLHIWHVPKACSSPLDHIMERASTSASPSRTGQSTPLALTPGHTTMQRGSYNWGGQAQPLQPLEVEILRSQNEPEIKFYIHEEALSVKVTYTDNDGTLESELYHLPFSDPRKRNRRSTHSNANIRARRHPPNHGTQFLIHAWHALVSCWGPMASGGSIYTLKAQGVIECNRCKSVRPSNKKCRMTENGCLECLKAGKYCPAQDRFYVMDGIYKLVTNGIALNWDVFARISGAIFYQPIFKSNHSNLHEYLLLTEIDQLLPSTLFSSSEMVAKPLLRAIETKNTRRVREFLEYMVKMATTGSRGRAKLGYMYPITRSLLEIDQRYPDFIITVTENSNYIEAATDDPLRELEQTIMPGSDFRSDHPELHAFIVPELLTKGTVTSSFTHEELPIPVAMQVSNSYHTKEDGWTWNPFHRQGRPVTLCLVPFMDLNSIYEYVYDESAGMIIKKNLPRSIFAKLALRGESEFFGTAVSEAILNSKWESGVKKSWVVFFSLHIIYYGLFCFTIPSYISWDPKLYPLRVTLIAIYMALGILFAIKGEFQQLFFGSWYGSDTSTPTTKIHRWRSHFSDVESIIHSILDYVVSFYNWVDTAAYALPIIAGLYTLITEGQWPNPASAFTILILWIHFLLQLRIFKQLGMYITILLEIGKSIGWLLVIITILIFAFAHSIFSLMYGEDSDDGSQSFLTFDRTLRTTWFFLSGDWSPADNYHNNRALAILTILFSFLTVIVFINVLIAVMSNIVDDMQKKADRVWLQMYAQIVAEMEVYWTLRKHNKPDIVYYEASTDLFQKAKVKKEQGN